MRAIFTEKKGVVRSIRLTDEEDARIRQAAEDSRQPVSAYIRSRILGGEHHSKHSLARNVIPALCQLSDCIQHIEDPELKNQLELQEALLWQTIK